MSTKKTAKSVVGYFADKIADEAREDFETEFYDLAIDREGKSPIERMLGAALLYVIRSRDHFAGFDNRLHLFLSAGFPGKFDDLCHERRQNSTIHITPEFQIRNYRADFFVQYWQYGVEVCAAIECDGHDFHERTKEQAKHDRKRDREFQALGITVLRFTGSEIYNDPLECAVSAIENLDRIALGRAKG